jgi:transcriptional regulator with XRE-family HTH domain
MSAKINTDERIECIHITPGHVVFQLMDGRLLAVPLEWYPRLQNAGAKQLNDWEITAGGFAARWPDLDEDLEISGLLAGNPAPELRRPITINGASICEYRESSGMSQAELAEVLGVRQATVSDWEQSKSEPSPLATARLRELMRKNALSKMPIQPASQRMLSPFTNYSSKFLEAHRSLATIAVSGPPAAFNLSDFYIQPTMNDLSFQFGELKVTRRAFEKQSSSSTRVIDAPKEFSRLSLTHRWA